MNLTTNKSITALVKAGVISKTYFKYLITGTPRSATTYMALLFQSAGIPIPHEQFFGAPGGGFWLNYAIGDSSAIAAPFLHMMPEKTTIIHIVRNPLKVLSSFQRWGFLEDNHLLDFWVGIQAIQNMPSILEYKGLDRYIHYYIGWNRMVEEYTKCRYRVEDINKNPKKIFKDLGEDIKGKKLWADTTTNASDIKKYLTIKDLEGCELKQDFIDYSQHLGYKL